MEKVIINNKYKHVNGSNGIYNMQGFEQLKYTNNVREIIISEAIQHIIIPIIATRFQKVPDTFQIWNLERVWEGDLKTNNFLLSCKIESDYLLGQDTSEVEVLQYAEMIYNIDVSFDICKMWVEYDTLLLPQEH